MKNILVPFDGSKPARRALKFALNAAASQQAMLHLLNVEPELTDYGMLRAYVTRGQHRKLMSARAHSVLASAEIAVKSSQVPHKVHIAYGDPASAIAKTARRLRCSSVVMGTRGLGNIGNMLLGSVAAKTLHLCLVPITLVH